MRASAACGPADRQYRANGCVTTRATAIGMSLKIVPTGLCGRPVRCAMVQWRASRVSTARSLSAKAVSAISPILPSIAAAVILCGWSKYGRGLTTSFCAHVPRTCDGNVWFQLAAPRLHSRILFETWNRQRQARRHQWTPGTPTRETDHLSLTWDN